MACAFLQEAPRGLRIGLVAFSGYAQTVHGFYSRDTFLLNPEGRVERIWRRVNPLRDADRVLAYLRESLGLKG